MFLAGPGYRHAALLWAMVPTDLTAPEASVAEKMLFGVLADGTGNHRAGL